MVWRVVLFFLFLASLGEGLFSLGARVLKVTFVDTPVKIDGRLEELVYQGLIPEDGFYQFHPHNGEKATLATQVYAFYDKKNLYFAFRCMDREPEKIVADITPFGEYGGNDDVRIYIDTFCDKQTYKGFAVNARGIRSGEKTLWDANACITGSGWTAEFRIPFKSLRFPVRDIQQWTINIRRRIFRLNEVVFWSQVGRDQEDVFGETFGKLEGIQGIKGGENVEIFPYAGYRYSVLGEEKDSKFAYGMDVKYGITSNLTLDLTSSPDYSEVESDPFFYQVSPYEHRLEENRPFYLEGSTYFDTPFRLFYSRRISNPTLAVKVTGKESGYSVGLLLAKNRQENHDAYHGVLRLKKDIFNLSSIGVIYSSIEEKGDWNRNWGMDIDIRFKDVYRLSGMAAFSYHRDGPVGGNGIYRLQFERVVDRGLTFLGRYERMEPNVYVPAGLIDDVDYQRWLMVLRYGFRWEGKAIEKVNARFYKISSSSLLLGYKTEDLYQLNVDVTTRGRLVLSITQSFGQIRARILDRWGQLAWEDAFYPSQYTSFSLGYEGDSRFQGGLSWIWIEDYVYSNDFTYTREGVFGELSGWVNFKLSPQWQWSVDYSRLHYRSVDRDIRFNGDLLGSTIKWQVSKRLSSFLKFQYDSNLERFQYDWLISYEPANVSRFFLSLKNYSEHRLRLFDPDARSIAFKVSYLIRI